MLDLDGDGVEITELTSSNTFFDTEGDGYKRRTAWAGTGDGVLAIDADGDGKITEREEIIFTDWDPSAKDDMEALRSVFDTDNDGTLDSDDKEFSKFRVVVTKADGTTEIKTLAQAGIKSIDLVADATSYTLSDGSSVDGLTTYTKSDDSKGKAAAVTFATGSQGYAVQNSVVTNPDNSTTVTNVARDADGGIAEVTVMTTSQDGKNRTITCDYGGDGVIDKVQTIVIVDNGGGSRTETITNKNGGGVLLDSTKTETNADGTNVSIWRDTRGGGYFNETETRVLASDVLTITLSKLNPNGTLIGKETTTTSADGLTRTESYDLDGNGTNDLSVSDKTVENVDGSLTQTISETSQSDALLKRTIIATDKTGQDRIITVDADGDGDTDLTSTVTVVNLVDGATVTTETDTNGNGSLRDKSVSSISADSLSQTTQIDRDGSGTYELTISDVTTLDTISGVRTQVITETNKDGTLRDKSTIVKSADGRGRDITVDRDGDGTKDRTETIVITGGISVDTVTEWNDNGSFSGKSIATTSADGLSTVTQIDADGTGTFETVVSSVTVKNGNGTATVTETVNNGDGSLRGKTVTDISADGLSSVTQRDRDGNGAFDLTRSDITVLKAGNAYERTVTETFANGALGSHSFTTTSADRNNIYSTRDLNGDGAVDQTETIDRQANGDVVDTVTNLTDHGSTINSSVTKTSANGLSTTVQVDENGDTAFDRTTITLTELKVDGSRTTTTTTKSLNNTEISQSEVTTSGNGLSITTDLYLNGDTVLDLRTKDVTVLEEDGDETRTLSNYNGNDKLRSSTVITISDDGLSTTTEHDADGDLAVESNQTDITELKDNGSTTRTVSNYNGAVLHDQTATTVSADGRTVTRTIVDNSAAATNQTYTRIVEADGDVVETSKGYTAGNALISQSDKTTSDNGLIVTSRTDFNADGLWDDVVKSSTVKNMDGSTVTTGTVNNADGSLRGQTVTTTSGNGLSVTSKRDQDGNGSFELSTSDVTVLNDDGSVARTVTDTFANGALAGKSITTTSADSDTVYAWRDTNGDGAHDQTQLTIREADGDVVDMTTNYRPDGQMINRSVVTTSANGLLTTTQTDLNADDVFDRTASQVTVLEADGGRATTTTTKAANGAQISKTTTTVSGNGLSVTTLSDINGDSTNDATTKDITVLNIDGSHTRTLSNKNGADTTLISNTKTVTSDDGLSVITELDLDGNASVDLTTKDVSVLEANGNTIRTVTNTNVHGLRDQSITATSADGRTVTTSSLENGSVDTRHAYVRTIEADGDIVEALENLDDVGMLKNRTRTMTSANGLVVTTETDQNADGKYDYSTTSVTTLNADGSKTRTVTQNNTAGIVSKSVSTTSDDGLTTTTKADWDGNGTYDLTTVSVRVLNQDGSVVDTMTETNANGSQRTQTVTTTSGDKKTVIVSRTGTRGDVQNEIRTLENNGDTVSTVESKNDKGAILSTIVTTTSANGLYEEVVTKNGANAVIDTQTTTIVLNADGGRTVTVAQDGAVDGTTVTTTSADGLKTSTQTTLTGVMTTTASSVDQTVLNADGSRTQTVTVSSPNGLKDRAVVTTSANGLTTKAEINVDGDATDDIIASSVTATDGSKVQTVTYKNLKTGTTRREEEVTTSVDGRTVTLDRDTDGNGFIDVTITTVKNADGSVTSSRTGIALGGVPAYEQESTTQIDLDGGLNIVTVYRNDVGVVIGTTTKKTSANGLNEAVTFDLNGDNIIDKTSTKTTVLNADGGTTETEKFIITGGIPSSTRVTTRNADGSETTTKFDLDGNGKNEQSSTTTMAMDGSIVHTFTTNDNETGAQLSSKTITIAANGLQEMSKADFDKIVWSLQSTGLTDTMKHVFGAARNSGYEWVYKIAKDTVLDTTTIFASSEGSNQWVRTVSNAQAATATHFIDANGIETWSWNIVSPTLWTANSSMQIVMESGSIQIDTATRDLYLERADNIYSAALGRDMGAEERQLLGQYIMGGVLNESLLASHILASEEFTAKFGNLNVTQDAAFVVRVFTNALGHLPSPEMRDHYVTAFVAGTMSRADVLVAIGSSIESGQLSRSIWQNGVINDTASYASATSGVTVDLAAPANNAGAAQGDFYTKVKDVVGSGYDDVIYGDDNGNILAGGAGNDTLSGSDGSDTLIGGEGADVMKGGTDTDFASYASASAGVVANLGNTSANAGDAAGDTYNNIGRMIGSNFDDALTGDSANNELRGGSGNDILVGGLGNDTLNGGSGVDTVSYQDSGAAVTVNLPTGTASGGSATGDDLTSIENIIGSNFGDTLYGDAQVNRIDGGLGADAMNAGDGDDLYIVDNVGDTAGEAVNFGFDTVESKVNFTLGSNIERLILVGSSNLTGTGNTLDNVIIGNEGINTLTGAAGNDTLDGKGGNDSLVGGAGNDTYVVDSAGDVISEVAGEGTDTVQSAVTLSLGGNVENLTLIGGSAIAGTGNNLNNVMVGNSATNSLAAGDGNDTLDGAAGADTMEGGLGDDIYYVDDVGDVLIENSGGGTETVYSSVSYTFTNEYVNHLTLTGTAALSGTGNTANNKITGNSASNTLTGAAGNDTLDGGAGADTLVGGLGDDTFVVDAIGDIVVEGAGEGADTVESSVHFTLAANAENLKLTGTAAINATGNSLNNVLTGNSGSNWLIGGTGNDTMQGGTGDDVYVVDNAADVVIEDAAAGIEWVEADLSYTIGTNIENLTLTGTGSWIGTGNSVANMMFGNSAANVFYGLDGNDSLFGAGGADTLDGGNGSDWAYYQYASQGVTANLATPASNGGDAAGDVYTSIENLWGSKFADTLLGSSVANNMNGSEGNDVLTGGLGADTIDGGAGIDTASYADSAAAVAVNLNTGTNTGGSAASDVLTAIENVIGSSLADSLTGNTLGNRLDGGAGKDTMAGGTGDDTYVTDVANETITEAASAGTDTVEVSWTSGTYILGTNLENITLLGASAISGTGNGVDNLIVGNSAANTLSGAAGNDVLVGQGGADTMLGGTGNDGYWVGDTTDVVTEATNEGTDTINSTATFTLGANVEHLTLTGGSAINGTGNDLDNVVTGNIAGNALTGENGNDTLDGGVGVDTLTGGTGNDTYFVDNIGDVVVENAGEGLIDQVYSAVTFTLSSSLDRLTLTGSAAIDGTGNNLLNLLTGNSGSNRLSGLDGDDTLDGGSGNDTLVGGVGSDTYVVDTADDVVVENAAEGTDTVQSSVTLTLGPNIENLTLTGASAIDATGNALNNTLTGNSGSNRLDGGAGSDTLQGGTGDDVYVIDAGDQISEEPGEGADSVIVSFSYTLAANFEALYLGGTGNFTATGNSVANWLHGNTGSNTLSGGDGDDYLAGLSGADALEGGNGNDWATYIHASQGVVANLDAPASNFGDAAGDSYTSIDNLWGSKFDDTLVGSTGSVVNKLNGDAGNDTLMGGLGADILDGGAGIDTVDYSDSAAAVTVNLPTGTASGGSAAGDDLTSIENIVGSNVGDTLYGDAQANRIDGGTGADAMNAGDGDDLYIVDHASDTAAESVNFGFDTVESEVSFTLGGNIERLVLVGTGALTGTGNALNNQIVGNADKNTLNGGTGDDVLWGGNGDDIYVIDSLADVVFENAAEGTDLVQSTVSFKLEADIENLTLTGSAAVNGSGNSLANTIVGNAGINRLHGRDGNDSLDGAGGNDLLEGGAGADTLNGGAGTLDMATYWYATEGLVVSLKSTAANTGDAAGDTYNGIEGLEGSALYGDKLEGDGSANRLEGNGGNDTLIGGAGADALDGGDGTDAADYSASAAVSVNLLTGTGAGGDAVSDTLASIEIVIGSALADTLTGSAKNDQFFGGAGNDTMNGGDGDDLLVGGAGNDTLTGGNGSDTVSYTASAAAVTVNLTTLSGSGGDAAGDKYATVENIVGSALGDILTGDAGNNRLDGGAGNDSLSGGNGNDTYGVDAAGDVVTEGAGGGTDAIESSVTFDLSSKAAEVENLVLMGSSAINGTGTAGSNMITGNSGANILNGGQGVDTLKGGAGNDTFVVDDVSDVVTELSDEGIDWVHSSINYALGKNLEYLLLTGTAISGAGNELANSLVGNASNNVLSGVIGDDWLRGDGGADTLDGGEGTDTAAYYTSAVGLTVSIGNSAINTGDATGDKFVNVENLYGSDHADVLEGDANDNRLDGSLGADTLRGGAGNDTYVADNIGDVINESASEGIDLVSSTVSYTLSANVENLTLLGSATNGTGSADDNTITGNAQANLLSGANGNDTLIGGVGSDTLTGGSGDDTYQMNLGDGVDQIAASASDGSADRLKFDMSVSHDQLWFSHSGEDLVVSIIGTSDSMTVKGWYAAGNDQLDRIEVSDGDYLFTSEVGTLVTAMAALTPPPLGQTALTAQQQQQLAPVLAAWHQAA